MFKSFKIYKAKIDRREQKRTDKSTELFLNYFSQKLTQNLTKKITKDIEYLKSKINKFYLMNKHIEYCIPKLTKISFNPMVIKNDLMLGYKSSLNTFQRTGIISTTFFDNNTIRHF